MQHPIHRVQSFQIMGPYQLRIAFTDGVTQNIDFLPILRGQIYSPLRDLSLFNKVSLDHEVGTLVWPNGADFDPATLHDWPQCLTALTEQVAKWDVITA